MDPTNQSHPINPKMDLCIIIHIYTYIYAYSTLFDFSILGRSVLLFFDNGICISSFQSLYSYRIDNGHGIGTQAGSPSLSLRMASSFFPPFFLLMGS